MALLASGEKPTRRGAYSLRRFAACFGAIAAAVVAAMALAPAAAADHETVGGGTFMVSNSETPCTDFQADSLMFTVCAGNGINVPASEYIIVPLGAHLSVSCDTYAPNGMLFEHDDENLADIPHKQQFWAEQGWGPYTPQAMCQMW
jgi:hypothetical protein